MHKRNLLSAAVIAAFGLMSLPTFAQTKPDQLERVEVTGSSIKRIAAEASVPVQAFSRKDIEKSGVTTVTDFIQQLPVMQGFTVSADSVGGGGGGITTASIHDVGEQYTLVLLNGRRVAPATSGTTIDLNSIPLAAIERIEVLTDGASALYGADAIAGVVNFILKKGAAPFTITARTSKTQHGGGGQKNFSISKGWGDVDRDGYSLFAAVSYDRQKQLKASQRDFAKTGIIEFTDQQGRHLTFFNGSSRSIPPNVDVRYLNPSAENPNRVSTVSFSPYLGINGACPDAHVAIGRQCFFDYTTSVEIAPEQERKSLFVTSQLRLTADLRLFGELAYTDVSTLARIAPYPAEFGLSATHPYFAQYIQPNLTAAQLANLQSVNVKYRLYDMGNRAYDYAAKATHVVAGVEGLVAGWDGSASVTFSTQKQPQNYVGGFPLADKFNAAIQAQQFDPFPYTLGTMPKAQLDALRSTQYIGNYNTTTIKMIGIQANASREVFKLPGGAAMLGLGADVRTNSYELRANKAVANAEILFDDPQAEYDLSRKSAGVFAELVMPVTRTLELSGAARFDNYSGVSNKLDGKDYGTSQRAGTFKFSGRYAPTKELVLRGSYGTGFRLASMVEIAQPQVDFGVTGGSYKCPFNAAYDPLGYFGKGYVCTDNQHEVFNGGNPDLKPEKSKQWTVGMVFEPSPGVSVGLDFWSVRIKNAVQRPDEALYFSDPATYLSSFTTKFKASNGLTYVAINQVPVNIGRVQNEGLDWDLRGRTTFDMGTLTARIGGTYLLKSRYTLPGTSDQWETSLGRYGSNAAVSFRNVISAAVGMETGPITNSLSMNYRSGYKDIFHDEENCAVDDGVDCIPTALDVPKYYTFDWQTKWTAMKGLDLTFGITNMLDEKPPLSLRNTGSHQLGYDPRYASPLGRTYYLQAAYKF